MKILIKLMLLIGLTVSVSLWSMSESLRVSLAEEKRLYEENEDAEISANRAVILNNGLGDLYFKLGQYFYYEKAPVLYSGETFEQKVKEYQKQAVGYYLKAKEYYEKATTLDVDFINLNKLCTDKHSLQEHTFSDPIYKLAAWAHANYQLGEIYSNGFGLEKPDYNKAIKYYEKAAMPDFQVPDLPSWQKFVLNSILSSIANSNFSIGTIYNAGQIGKPNNKKAEQYWKKVAIPKVKSWDLSLWAKAVNNLGAISNAKEYFETLMTDDVKKNALETWAAANNSLGCFYFSGKSPDYQKAKEYYEKAATPEVKDVNLYAWATANTNLGKIYYYGRLGITDYQKAKEFWEKVATPEVKNANLTSWAIANTNLGEIYYYGKLGAPDYQKAKEYFEKLAIPEVKNVSLAVWANANNSLGHIYYDGSLGAPDYQRAKEYFEKVATPEVKNVGLDLWEDASKRLEQLEKIAKEKSDKI